MQISRRHLIGTAGIFAGAGIWPKIGLAATEAPLVVKIALQDGRVVMAAQIGQNKPELFMLDTGGFTNLIREEFAQRFRLSPQGAIRVTGVGGTALSELYAANNVIIGQAFRQNRMDFIGTNAELGSNIAGALSASFMTAFDTDLDFVKGELRIHPKGRTDRTGLMELNARIKQKGLGSDKIFADLNVGGFSGEVMLDTGAPGDILLNGSASKASGLWNDTQPYMPWMSGGVGPKRAPSRIVRAPKMQIGRFVFERPLVRMLEPGNHTSYFGSKGLLGLNALTRLHLSTDVKRKTLWVAPNLAAQPEASYPASGVWVDEADGGLRVIDVGTGSPAAAAGLQAGDLVVGKPISYFREMAFGQQISLNVERNGKRVTMDYTLRDYL